MARPRSSSASNSATKTTAMFEIESQTGNAMSSPSVPPMWHPSRQLLIVTAARGAIGKE